MSDRPIPDEVMRAARAAFEERVNGMCMTWDHSFGLMSEESREGLRRCFRQIGEHDVIPAIARAIMAAEDRQREKYSALCYERSKEARRQAKGYEAQGDETSQVQCLIAAVEALDCAAAIRGEG